MPSRITIQDIADALGISRNTVSKAINNTGVLADATREKILKKAMELGYKQFSYVTEENAPQFGVPLSNAKKRKEVALFMTDFFCASQAAGSMLDQLCKGLSESGYSLAIHRIFPDEQKNLQLPPSFMQEKTAGIVCMEISDPAYCRLICGLSIPVLFIDSPPSAFCETMKADCLYMDSQSNIYRFVREMVQRGKSRIGFIGDYRHGQSFFERYLGYRNALYLSGLSCPAEYCITKYTEVFRTPPLAEKLPAIPGGMLPKAGAAS